MQHPLVAISPNDKAVRLDELGYTDLNDSLAEMKIHARCRLQFLLSLRRRRTGGEPRLRAAGDGWRLVNVWATWCVPCKKEFPDLVDTYRMYRGRGLEVITYRRCPAPGTNGQCSSPRGGNSLNAHKGVLPG